MLPARLQKAPGGLVGTAQEGLPALSVCVGLGMLHELMDEELDAGGSALSTPDNLPISGVVPSHPLGLGWAIVTSTEPRLWDALEDEPELLPALVVAEHGGGVVALAELSSETRSYARSSKAANTLRAYGSDLRHFGAWCPVMARDPRATEADCSLQLKTYVNSFQRR